MSGPRWLIIAALLVVWLVWGSTYYAIRVSLEGFPPFGMASVRLCIAGGVLLIWARLRGHPWPDRRPLLLVSAAGVLNFLGGNGSVVWAEQTVSSGLVAILVGVVPVYTAAMGPFFGAPVTGRQWGGIALGVLGIVVLNAGGALTGGIGVTVALTLGSISWALGSMIAKANPLTSGAMTSGVQMLTGGIALAIAAAATHESVPADPPLRAIVAVIYLITFGSILAFSAYSYLLKHATIAVATSYAYVNPVVAVLIGVAIGGEHLGPSGWAGLAIIVAAVGLVLRK